MTSRVLLPVAIILFAGCGSDADNESTETREQMIDRLTTVVQQRIDEALRDASFTGAFGQPASPQSDRLHQLQAERIAEVLCDRPARYEELKAIDTKHMATGKEFLSAMELQKDAENRRLVAKAEQYEKDVSRLSAELKSQLASEIALFEAIQAELDAGSPRAKSSPSQAPPPLPASPFGTPPALPPALPALPSTDDRDFVATRIQIILSTLDAQYGLFGDDDEKARIRSLQQKLRLLKPDRLAEGLGREEMAELRRLDERTRSLRPEYLRMANYQTANPDDPRRDELQEAMNNLLAEIEANEARELELLFSVKAALPEHPLGEQRPPAVAPPDVADNPADAAPAANDDGQPSEAAEAAEVKAQRRAKAYFAARDAQWSEYLKQRDERIAHLREAIRELRTGKTKGPSDEEGESDLAPNLGGTEGFDSPATPENRADAARLRKEYEAELKQLENELPLIVEEFVPSIDNAGGIQIGEVGRLAPTAQSLTYYEVVEIIDEQNAVLLPVSRRPSFPGSFPGSFWLRGFPTNAFVVGEPANFDGIVVASGKTGNATLVERFDVTPFLPSEEELAAKRKARDEQRQQEAMARDERAAAGTLRIAKGFIEKKDAASARTWLEKTIDRYPKTDAATEARELLAGLKADKP